MFRFDKILIMPRDDHLIVVKSIKNTLQCVMTANDHERSSTSIEVATMVDGH